MQKGLPREAGQTLIFVLLGIVMIAFVGVAFYVGKITPKPPSEVVTSTPSPTPSPSADETANWKIYSDLINPYTVKYPSDWAYAANTDEQKNVSVRFFPPGADLVSGESLGDYEIGIIATSAKNQTLKDIAAKYDKYKTRTGYIRTDITIDGVSGYKVTNVAMDFPTDGVSLLYKEKDYFIFIKYYEENQSTKMEGKELFDQILATFKFI